MNNVNRIVLQIQRTSGTEDVPLPSYKTEGAAGMDICAANDAPIVVPIGGQAAVPTGFCVAVPEGYEAQVRPRSGLARNFGIMVTNSPGTIDADYRGEVQILLTNLGEQDFLINRGDRIAQLVIAPVMRVEWEAAETLPTTTRGAGGFGHTGRQ